MINSPKTIQFLFFFLSLWISNALFWSKKNEKTNIIEDVNCNSSNTYLEVFI
jgi:hypothetical protein